MSLSWGDVLDAQGDGLDPNVVIAEWVASLPFPGWAALSMERAHLVEYRDLLRIRGQVIEDIYDRSLSPRSVSDPGQWPEPYDRGYDDNTCPACGLSRW